MKAPDDREFRIRLQVGVTATFTLLMLLVVGITIALTYETNRKLALETADRAMQDAEAEAEAALVGLLEPVGRILAASASFLSTAPAEARTPAGMSVLNEQIAGLRHVYGLYFGLDQAGEFYQIVQLPDSLRTFGPIEAPVPEGAKLVIRTIDFDGGEKRDRYSYQAKWGEGIGLESGPALYDPRTRPWYAAARHTDDVVVSPIYTFASTGKPGLTFSKRVRAPNGDLFGVVGLDITLDALAEALGRIRIGADGRAFMLDNDGALVVGAGGTTAFAQDAGARERASHRALDPLTGTIIAKWREAGAGRHVIPAPGVGRYFASVAPLPSVHGLQLALGFGVAEKEFVDLIDRATIRVIELDILMIVLAIVATAILAKLMSRQIRVVASEARRIRDLKFDGDFQFSSRISEVHDLGRAVAGMKGSLRAFGRYVPKHLVRDIVTSQEPPALGGQRREVGILFTDLEGFTRWSQEVPPDVLARDLSRYLAGVCDIIEARDGIVDKFVGDAVMAYWNAPMPLDRFVERSCLATLESRDYANSLMSKHSSGRTGERLFYTRFGLHTGEVFVGNVGSETRMDYTVVGGAVNLGSRLEPLNKRYGTQILASQAVERQCKGEMLFRWVDTVLPVGAMHAMDVYELLSARPEWAQAPAHLLPSDETLAKAALWTDVQGLYRGRRWDDLNDLLHDYERQFGRDGLSNLYLDRVREFQATPPPPDWNYVTVYLSKR